MAEGGDEGAAAAAASSSSSTLLCGGGRQRFEVELRPGETTIVSWKKLMKDANKAANKNNDNKTPSVSAPPPSVPIPAPVSVPVVANPALDARIAPAPPPSGAAAENEASDAPAGSRFSAVIEKIERLYMGKNSSDEEDLNDVPDDDEYDTEDSFIDDTELDEYFQVDNSAIKHDGFFVNRGKLERTNEPTSAPTEQPKKRRRKDSTKGDGGSNDANVPNKHMKVSKKEASKKIITSVDKNITTTTTPSRSITLPPNVNNDDVKYQSPVIALGTVIKKPSDSKNTIIPSPTNGENRATMKNIDKPKKHATKLKDVAIPIQRVVDKSGDVQSKSQGQVLPNNSQELNQLVMQRVKTPIHQADTKASESTQQPKNTPMARKEGLSTKLKNANIMMLEKAIRDLEKIVAETRPPSKEVAEADNSSQAVKKRMPPEIRLKLAKVAKLAHAIHGEHSKELLKRLMSILGHLIQLRSLRRNLQNMVSTELLAKESKDGRLQQLKKEVDEMVKIRAPMMKQEAIELQAGSSDDFQETSTKEKSVKTTFTTDDALEDKICDLYDLFIEGLDEDSGPQVKKLYAELADLWPKGFMDNHGIKRAICRAKERRKALQRRKKDQESIKRKKLLASKTETLTIDPGSVGAVQHGPEKLAATESSAPVRSISNTLAAITTAAKSVPNSSNVSTAEKPKNEKQKASEVLVKKKAKKNPEIVLGDGQSRSTSGPGEEKRKSNKSVANALMKPATPSMFTPGGGVQGQGQSQSQPTEPTANKSADVA